MTVSVIIPTLNAPTLARTLHAVRAQDEPPREVIVVGRDRAGVAAAFPGVTFIDTGRPVGPAEARNLGMAAASGQLFLFCDADCIPRPDWLARHRQRHAEGAEVVGGGVVLDGSNYWAQSDNVAMFHEYIPEQPRGRRALLPTLNLSVQRSVVDTVGGMDESLLTAEDADWTIRMRRAGYALHFEPEAIVHHSPVRTTWAAVARHFKTQGYNSVKVRLRYPAEWRTPRLARHATWWRLFAPLIAARITTRIYKNAAFWPYLSSLPVVYASKILYCLGAARAVATEEVGDH